MRIKTIIVGAIAALSLATLSANAGNPATHRVPGSVVSLVAATTAVAKADRDAVTVGIKGTAHEEGTEAVSKPVVAVKPAAPKPIQTTPACQQAINNLKAMRQADVTEDAAERTREQSLSASAKQADQAEDTAEAQQWRSALMGARAACLPQPTAACEAAIAGVQALVQANRTEELWDRADVLKVNWPAQLASLRSAFATVATACGDRD